MPRTIEPGNSHLREFYSRLLACLRHGSTQGNWQLLECAAAWAGNWTSDCFVCYALYGGDSSPLIVAINYAPNQSQCYLQIPFTEIEGKTLKLRDLMGQAVYDRRGDEISARGMYLDLPPWGYHVFELTTEDRD